MSSIMFLSIASAVLFAVSAPDKEVPPEEVLFETKFAEPLEKDWHHEGIGRIYVPQPGVMRLDGTGGKQGGRGCMAFCRLDFPDNIAIEYDFKSANASGLLITFVAVRGRGGEDMITELPPRTGVFNDYRGLETTKLQSYHLSLSRYNDEGEHTGRANWRRNPAFELMATGPDPCKEVGRTYHVRIEKEGPRLEWLMG